MTNKKPDLPSKKDDEIQLLGDLGFETIIPSPDSTDLQIPDEIWELTLSKEAKTAAKVAFDSIISNLSNGSSVAILQLTKELERLQLSYGHADSAFSFVEMFLNDYIESLGNDLDKRTKMFVDQGLVQLRIGATLYFGNRITNEIQSYDDVDVLVELGRGLEVTTISSGFREALESVKEIIEKKIAHQRKRAKLRKDFETFDEPKAQLPPESIEAEKNLKEKIRDLEAKAEAKQRQVDEKVKNDALSRGLTARRLMYLLDREMPIFKNAETNAARGELAYMLTGLGGGTKDGRKGEKIRQSYSTYKRHLTNEDREWLESWKAKLNKVPRNRGGTL